ncbi:MAG: hypothetical protein C4576_03215 [Desulfobacteraceae bacterium]|nr:MAG: hypothetical protein C4576_03215 [Desulfobacteraceae bacterium]
MLRAEIKWLNDRIRSPSRQGLGEEDSLLISRLVSTKSSAESSLSHSSILTAAGSLMDGRKR